MIRYAAENGFDRIAWTRGEQQVERYSSALRKAVDGTLDWMLKTGRYGVPNAGWMKLLGAMPVFGAIGKCTCFQRSMSRPVGVRP